ncbi:MAG: ABC transporter permease [Oligoflexia bacterium]|nr:ABC transporter permease [Oligoflexia bacterium]
MMLLKIAFRNLFSRKLRTVIVGSILFSASVLAIIGGALVESIAISMKKSLTESLAGDIQIYSSKATEKFSIIGNQEGNFFDVKELDDFAKIKRVLGEKVPNISAIIPQGVNFAYINPGNILDNKLEKLRELVLRGEKQITKQISEQTTDQITNHIRNIIKDISLTYESSFSMVGALSEDEKEESKRNINIVMKDDFWKPFNHFNDSTNDSKKVLDANLEFLENKIAPLIVDDTQMYFYYIGTIPHQFMNNFPLAELVKGDAIPQGKRGFLFNDYVYETQNKHRVARRLDEIKKKLERDKEKISKSKVIKDLINANIEQVGEIYGQMTQTEVEYLKMDLIRFLSINTNSNTNADTTKDIKKLLEEFFNMNDENFFQRYNYFYTYIAPKIILYRIKIGDTFPMKAFTRSGYSSSVNLKVYGTFRFKNFEHSPIAGNFNIMDLMSFRDLYGYMSSDRKEENKKLQEEMDKFSMQTDGEELFAKKGNININIDVKKNTFTAEVKTVSRKKINQDLLNQTYSDLEMENGVVINAAIILKDKSKTNQTLQEIQKVSADEKLNLKVVDWQEVTGSLGQFVTVIRAILYGLLTVILTIAIFIIMNSMLMSALERTKEIGTMRAIGASKKYILKLIMLETFAMGSIFSILGIGVGMATVFYFKSRGIPAPTDIFLFLFSGPRLYLSLHPIYALVVYFVVVCVSLLSSIYPAHIAVNVSPIRAMQRD